MSAALHNPSSCSDSVPLRVLLAEAARLMGLLLERGEPVRVCIEEGGFRAVLTVESTDLTPPAPATPAPAVKDTPLTAELRAMFAEVGRRMSGGEAAQWLQGHGKRYAEGTVKQELCRMRKTGDLTNTEDSHGKGYGLAEWSAE